MDMILRGIAVYFCVWVMLRLTGRRTMSQTTTFDFVLLLIIGEATQQALLGNDFSVTNAVIVVLTLITIDRVITAWRVRSKRFERVIEGLPVVIMERGRPLSEPMKREHVDEQDILHAARHDHGIASMDGVRHAVLEPSGGISIIPEKGAGD